MINFKVRMKIICVDDAHFSKEGEEVPVKGKIYTIRDMIYVSYMGHYFFRLEEIVNSPRQYIDIGFCECLFSQRAFKPVEYIPATQEIFSKFPLVEERLDTKIKETETVNP